MNMSIAVIVTDGAVWPPNQPYLRPIVMTGYLMATAVLAFFIAKRTSSWKALRSLSIVRILILAVLVDSFLFVFTSAILIFGIGTSYTESSCALGIWWCIFLYATSKVAIYLFLMERVHLVYSQTAKGRVSRLKSPWYRASMCFFTAWIGVAIAMIVGRISYIREHDRECIIGLKLYSTVLMLSVDLAVNVFLTTAFVYPVYKSKFTKARSLARNSCIAAIAALVTSFANIALLTAQHGKQLSWVCLGSCGLDVTFNAILIYIVTNANRSERETLSITSNNRRASVYPNAHGGGGGTQLGGAGTHIGATTFARGMDYDDEREVGPNGQPRLPMRGNAVFPAAPMPVVFKRAIRPELVRGSTNSQQSLSQSREEEEGSEEEKQPLSDSPVGLAV